MSSPHSTLVTLPPPIRFAERLALLRELSKSGIVALVLISVLGGYLIGQPFEQEFSPARMLLTLLGVLFLASGSSALNQYQERAQDALMPRTAGRPLPSGRMTTGEVLAFVGVTTGLGLFLLARISPAVLGFGLAAVLSYNGLYTMWWKRQWAYGAVPGAIPGALPILIGYAAASGEAWNPAGIYLFFILFYWQMPHFWVLALRFQDDYARGRFPTLPVALGEGITVLQITIWCLGYIAIALMAPLFLRVGGLYLAITLPMCGWLLWKLRGFVRAEAKSSGKAWLGFFLWINFSLIFFIGAAVLDLWRYWWLAPFWVR